MTSYREYGLQLATTWQQQTWGARLLYAISLFTDLHLEGIRQAVLAGSLDQSPDDALPYEGSDTMLERYPLETSASHRARLQARWETWPWAGTEQGLLAQLAASGYPGTEIYDDADWHREPQPWWSQFWVVFPEGTHTVGYYHLWDETGLYWDEDIVWSSDRTSEQVSAFRKIVQEWRPAHVVCRELLFELPSSRLWDAGHVWDESGLYWGANDPPPTIELR